MLDKHAIGIRAEFDGGAFKHPASGGNFRAEFDMRFDATSQTGNVIDDDDQIVLPVLFQERQHLKHGRTTDERAGHIIAEHADNLIGTKLRKLAAARFLRVEAIAFPSLFFGAYAAVYDRLLVCILCHGAKCLIGPNVLIAPSLSRSTGPATPEALRLAQEFPPLKA
ncbi:MAG: hypothetical protein Q8R81_04195 [Novosphingobium sp.]|nr:hypothetical protein [Novosphingobium sp.]MDP3549581.1 hypothetical protein [Novosphingobium sp.]